MGIAAIIFGVLSLVGMIVAFFPCLGSLNWIVIPFAVIGLIISCIAVATETEKVKGIVGIIMCSVAMLFGFIRLIMGGGVF